MFDVLITGGDVHDGSGGGPVRADVGIRGDRAGRAAVTSSMVLPVPLRDP